MSSLTQAWSREALDTLKQFKGYLQVTFVKADGSLRKLRGTMNLELMPQEWRDRRYDNKAGRFDATAIFDLDIEEWRSFRNDSIVEVHILKGID
jgi:hypothetical protein